MRLLSYHYRNTPVPVLFALAVLAVTLIACNSDPPTPTAAIATYPDGSDSTWNITTANEASRAANSPHPSSPEIIPITSPVPGAVVATSASTDSTRVAVALASADTLGTLALLDLPSGRRTILDLYSEFIIALAASD